MAAKPLRATPYAALQPSHSHRKSGQSICFKTGQFYLLLTVQDFNITRTTFCVLSTSVLILVVGFIAFMFAPHQSTLAELALAAQILIPYAEILKPKPETRFIYGLTVLALPFAALASAMVANRIRLRIEASAADVYLFATITAGAIFLLAKNPLLPAAWFTSMELASLLLSSALITVCLQKLSWHSTAKAGATTTTVLCFIGVALTFGLRVFGPADAIAESAHLGAFLYSINQIHLGGTCLADVVTQYGCYGELYKPVFSVVDLNVINLTLVNAMLQSIALVAVLVFCSTLIQRPLYLVAAASWIFLCLYRIDGVVYDVYYQYTPLRFFFPALSLLLAVWWCKHQNLYTSFILGAFSAGAVFSNLDSGIAVAISLGVLTVLPGIGRSSAPIKVGSNVLVYALSVAGALFLIQSWLSFRSGFPVDLMALGSYAKIFAGSGFMMLPTPAPPSTWTLAALAAVASGAVYSPRLLVREASTRDHLLAYVTVLAIGLFGYYLGRSHPFVLVLCVWPFVIVIFALLERFSDDRGEWSKVMKFLSLNIAVFSITAALVVTVQVAPAVGHSAFLRWSQIVERQPNSAIARDIAFIKANVSGSQTFEVLAQHQAVIHAELQTKSKLPGPGVAEILLKEDARILIDALVQRGPDHLFIGKDLLQRQALLMNTSPWLSSAIPDLRQAYALESWSGGYRMMHLVRKPYVGIDLFDVKHSCVTASRADTPAVCYKFDARSQAMVGPYGTVYPLPFDILPTSPKGTFRLGMVVVPDQAQVSYSTVVSSHCCDHEGFVVHALPGEANLYVLTVGDGTKWTTSTPFHLVPGRANNLVIDYRNKVLKVELDHLEIFSLPVKMASSPVGLTLGNWFAGSRPFLGRIDEAWVSEE